MHYMYSYLNKLVQYNNANYAAPNQAYLMAYNQYENLQSLQNTWHKGAAIRETQQCNFAHKNSKNNTTNTSEIMQAVVDYIYESFWFCCQAESKSDSRTFYQDWRSSKWSNKRSKKMPNEITFGNSLSDRSLVNTLDHFGSQISTALTYVSKAYEWEAPKLQRQEFSQQKSDIFDDCCEAQTNKPKRDMVNYDALEGHPYEIIDNPDRTNGKGARLYICKYDGWNKSFSK